MVRDLEAAGIEVVRIDELRPGVFAPYYVLPAPGVGGWVTRPALFRESVRIGLIEGIPRGALR